MPYHIIKASRNPEDSPPYVGPTCDMAHVPRGKVYAEKDEACADAERLSAINPVGFIVVEDSPYPIADAITERYSGALSALAKDGDG